MLMEAGMLSEPYLVIYTCVGTFQTTQVGIDVAIRKTQSSLQRVEKLLTVADFWPFAGLFYLSWRLGTFQMCSRLFDLDSYMWHFGL